MEGEKELLIRIKNSIKDGLSEIEITKRLLARGYKIEYVDVMLKRSKRSKKILWRSFLFMVLLVIAFAVFTIYRNYSPKSDISQNYPAPNWNGSSNVSYVPQNITEITPGHISSLLFMMGATKLHKNLFTFDKPKICFRVSAKDYLATIDGKTIKTEEEKCNDPDINIILTKEEALDILNSQNIVETIKQSISNGKTSIEMIASKLELGAKGYLSLQESLS